MEKTSCFGEFAKYTSLNVMGMLGLSCYILADTFFVANGLGADGLAALNLAIPIYNFIHGCGLMTGMGGATKYSIRREQGDAKSCSRIFTNAVCLGAALAVVFVLAGLLSAGKITALLGAQGRVAEMTKTYLKVLLLFSPAFICNDVLLCFVRNDGAPRLAMLAMLGGSFSNIILDYIFIFPLKMGIFGAVFATGCAPMISMLILSGHLRSKARGFHFEKAAPCPGEIRSNLSLGFPSLVTEASSGIVIIVFNMIILGLKGNVGVAAYGVIANISLVIIAVFTGVAQGLQPVISRAYGKQEQGRIRQLLGYGIVTVLVLSAAIYGAVYCFAPQITGVFNSEGSRQLAEIAVPGLKIYFTAIPFAGVNIVMTSYFSSTEKAFPAQALSLLRGIILIIPVTLLAAWCAGITGVWLAFPATEAVVCIISIIFRRNKKLMGMSA